MKIVQTIAGRAPYPGLRPFEAEEADLFAGRAAQINEMLSQLESTRFLAVVGASGCGKSSLVRAGLLPAIRDGLLMSPCQQWQFVVMRPGDSPYFSLAQAGCDLQRTPAMPPLEIGMLEYHLRAGNQGLVHMGHFLGLTKETGLLLLVDQFEEMFRFRNQKQTSSKEKTSAQREEISAQRNEAISFVELMLESAKQQERLVYVVLTMRSDFIGDCDVFPGLPEQISHSQFLTPRMTRNQLADAISVPLKVCGVEAESGFVGMVLNDVGNDPDLLPLMQHALMRSYLKAKDRNSDPVTITIKDYEQTGGFAKALNDHAEEVYQHKLIEEPRKLKEEPSTSSSLKLQHVAEKLFRALGQWQVDGRLVRRPVTVSEAVAETGASIADIITVAQKFAAPGCHLLTFAPPGQPLDEGSKLDLSHESLLRNWARLQDWMSKEAESASTYRRLADAVIRRNSPWRRPELDEAEKWLTTQQPTTAWAQRYTSIDAPSAAKLLNDCRQFITRSTNHCWWQAFRLHSAIALITVFAAVAGVCWYMASQNSARAKSAELTAKESRHAAQVSTAWQATKSFNVSLAERVIEEMAPEYRESFETQLVTNLLRRKVTFAFGPDRVIEQTDRFKVDPDGKRRFFACQVMDSGASDEVPLERHANLIQVYDSTKSKDNKPLFEQPICREHTQLKLSRSGKRVASIFQGKQSVLSVWDVDQKALVRKWTYPDGQKLVDFRFIQQDQVIAAWTTAGLLSFWDVKEGRMTRELDLAALSSVGAKPEIVWISEDGAWTLDKSGPRATLWNLQAGKLAAKIQDINKYVVSLDESVVCFWKQSGDMSTIQLKPDLSGGLKEKIIPTKEEFAGNETFLIESIKLSTNGERLILTAAKREEGKRTAEYLLKVWNCSEERWENSLELPKSYEAIATPLLRLVVVTTGNDLEIHSLNKEQTRKEFHFKTVEPNGYLLSTDERTLVLKSAEKSTENRTHFEVWSLIDNQMTSEFSIPNESDASRAAAIPADTLRLSADGRSLFVQPGHFGEYFQVISMETGKELFREIGNRSISTWDYSTDGKKLGAGHRDGSVSVWNIQTGEVLYSNQLLKTRVVKVQFSADGSRMVCGDVAGNLHLFEMADGKPVSPILNVNLGKDQPMPLEYLTFLEKENRIVALSRSRTLLLDGGSLGVQLDLPGSVELYPLNQNPASDYLVSREASDKDASPLLRFWSIRTAQSLPDLPDALVKSIPRAVASSDDLLATIDQQGKVVLYRVSDWQSLNLAQIDETISDLKFLGEGRRLALTSSNSEKLEYRLRAWELEEGKILAVKDPAVSLVTSGTFVEMRSDEQFAIAWEPQTGLVTIWDITNGQQAGVINGVMSSEREYWGADDEKRKPRCSVQSRIESPNGGGVLPLLHDGELVAADPDGGLRIWRLSRLNDIQVIRRAHDATIFSADFLTQDGDGLNGETSTSSLVSGGGRSSPYTYPSFKTWDLNTLTEIRKQTAFLEHVGTDNKTGWGKYATYGHMGPIYEIVSSPTSELVATVSFDGMVQIWQAKSMVEPSPVENDSETTTFHRTFARVTSLPKDHLPSNNFYLYAVAWHPNGKYIAASYCEQGDWNPPASPPQKLRIYDVTTGDHRPLEGHPAAIWSVNFNADGTQIVTAGEDNQIIVWDYLSGEKLYSLDGHEKWVLDAKFTPDGKRIVSGSLDKTMKVWNVETKQIVFECKHDESVTSLVITPDGQRAITASGDKLLRIWNLQTGQLKLRLDGHSGPIWCVRANRDWSKLVSCGEDDQIRIWALK